jgi:hypothetical protein
MSEKITTELPGTLTFPSGTTIDTEELIQQLALLRSALAGHLDAASQDRHREALSYPEAHALYDIASSAYLALAGTFYHREIAEASAKNLPSFV